MKKENRHLSLLPLTKLSLLFFLLVQTFLAQAQDIKPQKSDSIHTEKHVYSLEGRVFYGFINNYHTELMRYNTHLPAFEISLSRNTTSNQGWPYLYHYPQLGLGFFFTSFNRSEVFGSVYGLYPYLNFPLFRTEKQNLSFRIGLGLGYFNRQFDPIENYENLAIGSRFNALIHFMLNYQIRLSPSDNFSLGLGFIHFSNGSIATPNYGINLSLASIAYAHSFGKESYQPAESSYTLFHSEKSTSLSLDIQTAYGLKRIPGNLKQNYNVMTQSVGLSKNLNRKSSLGIGLDFSWDESHKALLAEQNEPIPTNFALIKYGFCTCYKMHLDRLSFKVGLGTYLYGKEKTEGPIYEKLALNYLFYKNLYFGLELKAHAARAAYLTYGIGYQIKLSKAKR